VTAFDHSGNPHPTFFYEEPRTGLNQCPAEREADPMRSPPATGRSVGDHLLELLDTGPSEIFIHWVHFLFPSIARGACLYEFF
jgi:hypothetical protein